MEFTSCLPKDKTCELKNDRYDPYRIIFGNKQQESIENLSYFLVGLGSMGCEYIKNFSIMGVATKEKSKLYIADCKTIKKSNLNTHFLFRKEDIGKMKGEIAIKSAHEINPNINIEFTQSNFDDKFKNDAFFENLDGVCNAVDNTIARKFVDSECVFYNIPQIFSQTTKLEAYYQDFVPKITECYSSINDYYPYGKELSGPYHYPINFEDCYLWSSDIYRKIFEQNPQFVSSLFNKQIKLSEMNDDDIKEMYLPLLTAKEFYIDEKCENFIDCIKWARIKFNELFYKNIISMINQFPEDLICCDNQLFWSGKKKIPKTNNI